MAIEIKVPNLPESVSSATIAAWHVKAGDTVKREQNLLDLETDKVMLEVPALEDGVLTELRIEAGATVQAGDILGVLEPGAVAASTPPPAAAVAAAPAVTTSADNDAQGPAVRKLLSEMGLSASQIPGTGKGGRLTPEDVKNYAAQPKPATPAPATVSAPAPLPGAREEQRVPMTRIRARIAERLLDAKNSTAMLTTFNEVDLKAVSELRAKYKTAFEKTHGVKLGFMSFFVKAAIEALKKFPVLNASVDGNDIIYHGYYDIGIAVSSERGLVVPILRDADQLSMAEIEKAIADFGTRAKANKLTMDDLTGGTFSITNGGVFGSMLSTPIINPPQSAILGMHGIIERPIAVDGRVEIRPMMYLAMSYDHRIIDGREAVVGLRTMKESLEDPAKILLQL
ncbi:2-oxoglutarate dehydrogenase complex dihydrolipoyllysine-residue succinyltransferase [Sinimarinibacterium sp. CAU 1509]|uniref:2-oxoglutarate dehydrogenase complex dihydrolipoyllysine-residue succinyltransferase n=1 Tax=Sinimarinibacterium sp. CAU 1509 TaxID=2562283 RepID=UPI0010AB9B47|nr:2-oxoglutarate dehydrogenase complex dihydrolipoyllysine-residue succinyltransferase [Sinimarinibacterium sp. CAU 1509]TJY60845.1 2-oxoglutarate dehydrogenase complex dihydrolipoyllysine-residue succinyltransferase [Sinimarinibacterium sp. CAU 1509]